MPSGARSTISGRTRQAPAWLPRNTSAYFLLSRKDRCSGPATSSGATSTIWRAGSAAFSSAPARAARSARLNGPALVKKRGSATSVLLFGRRLLHRGHGLPRVGRNHRLRKIDRGKRLVHQSDDLLGHVHLIGKQQNLAARQDDVGSMLGGHLAGGLIHGLLHLAHHHVEALFQRLPAGLILALEFGDGKIEGTGLFGQNIGRQGLALLLDLLLGGAQGLVLGHIFLLEFLPVFVQLDQQRLRGL